jgi:hypothetical protein
MPLLIILDENMFSGNWRYQDARTKSVVSLTMTVLRSYMLVEKKEISDMSPVYVLIIVKTQWCYVLYACRYLKQRPVVELI